ncbi:hypothetical protein COK81_15820 [Bacillus thuringiensis]|uniref:Uncharacterized protein n=1 Tax=Bacillus thuringiensis TaxID=1428 RepID=A0A9X7G1L0_BACTU|nr:hypothetical protein COK81_15820 [Bacillus thuringiensis]
MVCQLKAFIIIGLRAKKIGKGVRYDCYCRGLGCYLGCGLSSCSVGFIGCYLYGGLYFWFYFSTYSFGYA